MQVFDYAACQGMHDIRNNRCYDHRVDQLRIDPPVFQYAADRHSVFIGCPLPLCCHTEPLIVTPESDTGIRVSTDNPSRTGPDRIVNAAAGYEIAKGPAIVIDFGTATTYDLIGPDGTLEACIIAPGIETAGRSLWGGAAMLPAIQIRKPESILARETVSGMQGGLVFGAIGQTEYIVKRMKEESGWEEAYVIATGGLGKIIAAETECIDLYDPQLTLNGLRLIYDRIKEK